MAVFHRIHRTYYYDGIPIDSSSPNNRCVPFGVENPSDERA
jgi:hypothetical protein